ncbi:MAG: hypothetical protein MZV63_25805 [Marinilabiliales bacterium]|nr:hypothetical protein [Marinilabiliales bacterium]
MSPILEYQSSELIEDILLTGDFEFLGDFTLKAIVGGTNYNYSYRSSSIRADNLSIPDFYDISNGTGTPTVNADASEKVSFGVFGDLTLGYSTSYSLTSQEGMTGPPPLRKAITAISTRALVSHSFLQMPLML